MVIATLTVLLFATSPFVEARVLSQRASQHYRSCLDPDVTAEEKYTCKYHTIIFDAGSTGTRIHIYEFRNAIISTGIPFILDKDILNSSKPGLSDFALRPELAKVQVRSLLQRALDYIPSNLHQYTPIMLKATAGLRLLADEQSDAILDQVRMTLKSSGFMIGDINEDVSVLTGDDEGIFGWLSLNYLINQTDCITLNDDQAIHLPKTQRTATALDLGGGSTQITFRFFSQEPITLPRNHLKKITYFGNDLTLYTHSYLGNGINAARLRSLQLFNKNRETNFLLNSPCLPVDYSFEWQYNNEDWIISGQSCYSFECCQAMVAMFIDSSHIYRLHELKNTSLYAFSYYYYLAKNVGLIDDIRGGNINIADLDKLARKLCKQSANDLTYGTTQWHCFDLVYTYSLLLRGFGVSPNSTIFIANMIGESNLSWSLGAAFDLLNSKIVQNPALILPIKRPSLMESISNFRKQLVAMAKRLVNELTNLHCDIFYS